MIIGKYTPVKNYSPSLYVKTLYNKKKDKITSTFYEMEDGEDMDEGGQEVDPMEYLNERCYVKVAIKFDNIYTGGNSIALQVKLLEKNVSRVNKQRIMSKAVAKPMVKKQQQTENEEDDLPENY